MGPTTDEERRIQSYLQAQGAKRTPAELVAKVREAMDELRQTAAAVPAARFHDRPAPGEWSANDVLAHVVEAGALFAERVRRVLDGEPPAPPPASRESAPPHRGLDEWWALLEQDRAAFFARVLRADPAEHPERVIEHGTFGPLTWRETILFMRLHDLDHAGQLAKIARDLA
jgi:uncharacterized damage-inducible protein DinB